MKSLLRPIAVWLLMMLAESLHGTLRVLFLVPRIGDMPARQVGVFTGSLILFSITWLCIRWMRIATTPGLLAVGALWVLLTTAFEFTLGRLAFGLSWERILSDYDLPHGGLMPLGLLMMALSPWLAHRLRAQE